VPAQLDGASLPRHAVAIYDLVLRVSFIRAFRAPIYHEVEFMLPPTNLLNRIAHTQVHVPVRRANSLPVSYIWHNTSAPRV